MSDTLPAINAMAPPAPPSLLAKLAARFSVEPAKMLATLKSTAFKGEVSTEQMMALLIVADQYGLNPWTREIYAFPDKGGIVPVVGVDGWLRIINGHPQFDGLEYLDGPADKNGVPEWIECVIYRKDRAHAVRVREYLVECKRGTAPWSSHPRRMLRHKSTIQAGRVAFGFVGIYDPDEAERIVERDITPPRSQAIVAINRQLSAPPVESFARPPTFDELFEAIGSPTITAAALAEIRNLVPSVEGDQDRDELLRFLDEREAELAAERG